MMTKLPEVTGYDKEAGIRGLIQIAKQTRDQYKYAQRVEIVVRYLAKFERRMKKAGTPLTNKEENDILNFLMEIIAKSPREEKEELEDALKQFQEE